MWFVAQNRHFSWPNFTSVDCGCLCFWILNWTAVFFSWYSFFFFFFETIIFIVITSSFFFVQIILHDGSVLVNHQWFFTTYWLFLSMWIYYQLWSIKLWINFAIMCTSSECCLQLLGPWGRHVSVSVVLDHGLIGEMCFFFFKSNYALWYLLLLACRVQHHQK